MPIDDLDPMAPPPGSGAMPYDDPAQAEGEIAAPAVRTDGYTFDHQRLIENIDHHNIAEDMSEEELGPIGQKVSREFEIDLGTRSHWETQAKAAMDLAMQVNGKRQGPWAGSSDIVYPLMTTAAVQFAARAYPAIVQGRNVVKGVVVGDDQGQPMMQMGPQGPQPVMDPRTQQPAWIVAPGAKKERATRIGEHMSWQLLDQMSEWEEETDKLLHILPIIGCAFRKSFYDPAVGHNACMLVLAQNLVIDYYAKSMDRAPRLTEVRQYYPYEVEEQVRARLFIDQDYSRPQGADEDAALDFFEQHRWLDLDDDGYPEPYIVTVDKQSNKVARITARYDAEGVRILRETGAVTQIDPVHYYSKYDFLPNPDGGIYGVGFGQLLGPINESVNTTLNMLFDAAHLQTAGGGFIGRGPSMHTGSLKFKLGEWKSVNVPGQTMREAIVPFNHSGPSPQLISLLSFLVEAGKEVTSVNNMMTGDVAAQTMQPTTLLALIEQGQKVFSGIFKRVQRSMHKDFDKLYRLNRIYLENESKYRIGDEERTVSRDDYAKGAGVQPYADASMVTDMQKMARAQFLQSYQGDPNIKRVEVIRRVFDAAQIEKPEELIQEETGPNPLILAQTAELEMKGDKIQSEIATNRATQIEKMSAAVLNLAKADAENGSQELAWTAQQIDLLRFHLESLTAPADGKPAPKQLPPPEPMPQDMAPQDMGAMGMPPDDPLADLTAGFAYPQQ
jgi:chaperonin GroES